MCANVVIFDLDPLKGLDISKEINSNFNKFNLSDLNSLKNGSIEIEIEKNMYKAEILTTPLNQKNYKNS